MGIFNDIFYVFIRSIGDLSKEQRLSPKKQLQPTTKTAQIRKLGSPNAKKAINCRSPNSKKTQSPQQQQQVAHISAEHAPTAETSNAIQTARKLKKMLGSSSPPADSDESTKMAGDPIKRCNLKKSLATRPIKKQKRCHDDATSVEQNEPGPSCAEATQKPILESEPKPITVEVAEKMPWSRDEDRLLLEEIKKGLDDNIENITEIAHHFPNKTVDHIRERVDFLIDFLTKLRG